MFEKTLEMLESERREQEAQLATVLESLKGNLESKEALEKNLLSVKKVIGIITGKTNDPRPHRTRTFTEEHREKIRQKQIERWAKVKAKAAEAAEEVAPEVHEEVPVGA